MSVDIRSKSPLPDKLTRAGRSHRSRSPHERKQNSKTAVEVGRAHGSSRDRSDKNDKQVEGKKRSRSRDRDRSGRHHRSRSPHGRRDRTKDKERKDVKTEEKKNVIQVKWDLILWCYK